MPRPHTSRRAARWLDAGLVDVEFYSALRGRRFADAAEAAEDFVETGMGERLSPHPFLDFVSLPPEVRRAWRQGRPGQVLDLLGVGEGAADDEVLHVPSDPAAARAGMLVLAERLGREQSGEAVPARGSVDWPRVQERARDAGRVTVVVVAAEAVPTIRTVEVVLSERDEARLDVVVVDPGSLPHVALGLHAALHHRACVDLVRLSPPVSPVEAADVGLSRAPGATVVLLDSRARVRRGWLEPLLALLEDPAVAGVQPVVLDRVDTIHSAGLVLAGDPDTLTRPLAGHPREDARRLEGQPLDAIAPQAMALRAADVAAAGGLDERLPPSEAALDLCARLRQRRTAGFRVAPQAAVSLVDVEESPEAAATDAGLLERIGFESRVGQDPAGHGRAVVTGIRRAAADQLRWSLRLPSWPGRPGDLWGDTHFADALATALRDLGQDVVTRRRGAHDAGPVHLDDVALSLRGLYPIPPSPGVLNVLWVISHPDEVDPGELEGYDVVCAASAPWSAELASRTGREVVPLLQATEFESSGADSPPSDPAVVFVGNATAGGGRRERPLVRLAAEAGVPLRVFGRGWEELPPGAWCGEYVDNHRLPELYRRHGVVLADHWPDMARHGFVANRVFDALASGARVICDDVVGVQDLFAPDDVLVARTAEEVAAAFDRFAGKPRDPDLPRPSLSFRDRAASLVELVRAPGQPSSRVGRR